MNNYDAFWSQSPEPEAAWSIQKEQKVICFGDPGYINQWTTVNCYQTIEEAQKDLAILAINNPLIRYQIVDNRALQWIVK